MAVPSLLKALMMKSMMMMLTVMIARIAGRILTYSSLNSFSTKISFTEKKS